MDSALVPCSTATLTFSSGLLSTMDHSTTNSITSVLPVSSSVIDNKESDNLRLDAINHPSNINIPYNGQPTAILRCNTMPFDVRVLDLSSSVMVGRAVARFKPSSKNAIFDCKVLSRNHALLWYENEKFYLQDTKSSNGTFVNNQRLSYANTESEPKEVFSEDKVQFGVDVVDNTRKVSHGCVTATLELIFPSGDGVPKRSSTMDGVNNLSNDSTDGQSQVSGKNGSQSQTCSITCHPLWRSITIPVHRIVELENSLKEALNRESDLESKLSTLEKVLTNVIEATEKSWKSMVEEDRMLSRIELLESKLKTIATCNSYKTSDEKIAYLKQQMDKLYEQRELYETTAKESLLLSNNKFIQLNDSFTQIQADLEHRNSENKRLNEMNVNFEKQLETLADSHEKLIKEYDEITAKHKLCDETILKLKSDIEMVTSMGSTSTFTKSRELELESQLAEMEKAMIQSKGECKQSEDNLRDQLEMKINCLNDEITLLQTKLSQVEDEHKLCTTTTIKVNGTIDKADGSCLSVEKDKLSSSIDCNQQDTIESTDDNINQHEKDSSLKMRSLLKQIDELTVNNDELTDTVQNLTSTVKVQNIQLSELASSYNKCLGDKDSLMKQLVDQQTCHENTVSELKSLIVSLQSQVRDEKDKLEEAIKSIKSLQINSLMPSCSTISPSNDVITSDSVTQSSLVSVTRADETTTTTTTSSSSIAPAHDTVFEPAHTKDDEKQLNSSLEYSVLLKDSNSLVNCFNPIESPDGIFILYDLILATFFILLLYFGSPSVY